MHTTAQLKPSSRGHLHSNGPSEFFRMRVFAWYNNVNNTGHQLTPAT